MKLYELVKSGAVGNNLVPKQLQNQPLRLNPFLDFMKQWEKEDVEKYYTEGLEYVKFKYTNYKNDKTPQVKVLDFEYPGIKGQKTYGKRKDVLGWNINYVEGGRAAKREAINGIDDIADFTELLGGSSREKYERIVTMFPQAAEFLRRYMRDHITGLKHKKGIMWKRTDINKLIDQDQLLRGQEYV